MKKNNLVIILLFTFVVTLLINYLVKLNIDSLWTYGFSHNIKEGLTIYKDFNLVGAPLYPMIMAIFLKIYDSLFFFYILNAIITTSIVYFIYKINPKNALLAVPFVALFSIPNYNNLCLMFLFLLVYLEKRKSNDYFIGFVLGLSFLTKQSIGLLCLPTLFTKDFKKILKRIVGFIIPNAVIVGWFWLNGSLKNYINYCFLGLFDFASGNGNFNFVIIPIVLLFGYLVYKYFKTKDISYLYFAFFTIIAFPLFDSYHITLAIYPAPVYFIINFKTFSNIKYIWLMPIMVALLFVALSYMTYTKSDFKNSDNLFKTKKVSSYYVDNLNSVKEFVYSQEIDINKIYFMNVNAYIYKLEYNIPINEFDFLLRGNMGYKGEEKFLEKIKKLPDDSLFLFNHGVVGTQDPTMIYDYILNNYKQVYSFGTFEVYQKKL